MNNPKSRIIKLVAILLLVFGIYAVLDCTNALTHIRLPMNNMNVNYFGTVSNSLVTIGLFVATYILLNSRQVKKDYFAQEAVDVLLRLSYESCQKQIEFLSDHTIPMSLVKKTDFNDYKDSPAMAHVKHFPFSHNDLIMSYVDKGFLSGKKLETYLTIKSEYEHYVSMAVTFYDRIELVLPVKNKLISLLSTVLREFEKEE